ncbi:MAG TPA: type III pantothenate kinase [bacterium]|nr:type III pantothenate kinase [bacterium]HPQ19517.1 type III pantothenate kinase [bacterium]
MFLVLDIGNTNISIGIFKERKLLYKTKIKTNKNFSFEKYYNLFNSILKKFLKEIKKVFISSVYRPVNKKIEKVLKRLKLPEIKFLTINDFEKIIKIKVKQKEKVGIDRLVNVTGGYLKIKKNIIVVDAGTATTIDVIYKNGEFIGGIILPGIEMIMNSACEKITVLKPVKIKKQKSVIGKNTDEAFLSGLYFGYFSAITGIIKMIKEELKTNFYVIGTGGAINYFKNEKIFDLIDLDFTIKSINEIILNSSNNF